MSSSSEITVLLVQWSNGNKEALDQLLPLVEKELHRLAHSYMRREKPNHTLQTTALIHETYVRLVDQRNVQWQNRAHFFGIAAQLMRRILSNYARARHRVKRGGRAIQVSLSEVAIMSDTRSAELIALDEALNRLSAIDERRAKVVEMRYFGGLTVEETAEVLGVSTITVHRDWKLAKAWLLREMKPEPPGGELDGSKP